MKKVEGMIQDGEEAMLIKWGREHKKILEIGSWHGRSTRALAENSPGIVWAVDTWRGTEDEHQGINYVSYKANDGDNAFMQFCINNGDLIKNGKIIPIRMNSANANWVFNTLNMKFDMVFIDGNHSYQAVKSDILGTQSLLEDGALLCGHDYTNWFGVKQAVDELIKNKQIDYSIWHTIK